MLATLLCVCFYYYYYSVNGVCFVLKLGEENPQIPPFGAQEDAPRSRHCWWIYAQKLFFYKLPILSNILRCQYCVFTWRFLWFSVFFLLCSTCWIVWCQGFCSLCFVWRRVWTEKKQSSLIWEKGENADIVNQKNHSFHFCYFFPLYYRTCVLFAFTLTRLLFSFRIILNWVINVCLAHHETFIRPDRNSCLVVVSPCELAFTDFFFLLGCLFLGLFFFFAFLDLKTWACGRAQQTHASKKRQS